MMRLGLANMDVMRFMSISMYYSHFGDLCCCFRIQISQLLVKIGRSYIGSFHKQMYIKRSSGGLGLGY